MLERDYDLTRRAQVGAKQRYFCRDVFNLLDSAGRIVYRRRRTAELSEEILDLSSDGTPVVRWAYTAFTYNAEGKDTVSAGVAALLAGAAEDALPTSGTIVVEGNPEDRHSYFPDANKFGLSKASTVAFFTCELVLHTRAFWIMATRTHGGIDQLHRLGDKTTMPFSNTSHRFLYGDMYEATMDRHESTLRFDGVTVRHGHDAALLTCHTPYDISNPGYGPGHSDLVGHLWVDLASGGLVAGEARQTNDLSSVPLLDGTTVPMKIRFETSVELIPD
jgi:hypothetical protein